MLKHPEPLTRTATVARQLSSDFTLQESGTALNWACRVKGRHEVVRALIEAGAIVNTQDKVSLIVYVHCMCISFCLPCVVIHSLDRLPST